MQKSIVRDPLVSVIIPNYNHARYISDAIRSVLAQSYSNVEIIVVDDGSTDNSRAVIARFGEQVRCIHKKNAGLSAARNTGIEASQGELIGVLDADDIYTPNYLSTLVSCLKDNPDDDGVYCGYRFVDHQNNDLTHVEARRIDPEKLYEALLDGNFLVPESMFLRRKVYDAVGLFDESLRSLEDWDVWMRAARSHKILSCPEILTRHRVLPGSMSSDPLRMLTNRLTVLGNHVGPQPAGPGDSLAHRAYARANLSSCVEYLQYGSLEKAYERFRQMAALYPTLLTELDVFYQIGCGGQAKGTSGDLGSLNVSQGAGAVRELLEMLFSDSETHPDVRRIERKAYATAYQALGMLAYGAREFQEARAHFSRAFASDPGLLLNRQAMTLRLKSWLGPGMIGILKSVRYRAA